jgi:hypothetical protein
MFECFFYDCNNILLQNTVTKKTMTTKNLALTNIDLGMQPPVEGLQMTHF